MYLLLQLLVVIGKTSTKNLIASVLEQKYTVLKTQGNLNTNMVYL